MTYVVTSSHQETLKSGRQVFPGQDVSNKEAEENPRLIERGALTQRQKPGQSKAPAPAPAPSPPEQPEGEKQESPAPEPEAAKSTPPRPSRRTKAPASSVPNKEDDPK